MVSHNSDREMSRLWHHSDESGRSIQHREGPIRTGEFATNVNILWTSSSGMLMRLGLVASEVIVGLQRCCGRNKRVLTG